MARARCGHPHRPTRVIWAVYEPGYNARETRYPDPLGQGSGRAADTRTATRHRHPLALAGIDGPCIGFQVHTQVPDLVVAEGTSVDFTHAAVPSSKDAGAAAAVPSSEDAGYCNRRYVLRRRWLRAAHVCMQCQGIARP